MKQNISIDEITPHRRQPDAGEWTQERIEALFALSFADLLYRAQGVHRKNFNPNEVQLSTLISVKTGGCPEDCAYCPQSSRYTTGVADEPLMQLGEVIDAANKAKARGATRFCMGAAWRGPKQKDLDPVLDMVRGVKAIGLETCATLGLLRPGQAEQLKAAGLDFYNHNLDTSPDYYGSIIATREFEDRLDTIAKVRSAGLKVCCGGIVGMGESRAQRAGMIAVLANLHPQPESVPINMLVRVDGTPLGNAADFDWSEFVRTIACARIAMPLSMVRLSAGRTEMSESMQALCMVAGANSMFYGEKLLTTDNPEPDRDHALLGKLGYFPSVKIVLD
ncbi:MAG: biotin synthase BioB [Betaproteobacteria bacterium]|nr:biotin synthase BioB [Betaproteobacteria bacterium]